MEYRELGTTGWKVSQVCLGSMTWGEQNTESEGHAQLDYALERGVNFIDTAEIYAVPPRAETAGATERIIGTWLKGRSDRDKIYIASKVGGPNPNMTWLSQDGSTRRHNAKHITEAVDQSLKRLQTDYIDLYQLHWPDRPVVLFNQEPDHNNETPPEETLRALEDVVKAGKVRAVGVSNETAWGVMAFLREAERHGLPRMQSIQNAYSLVIRGFEEGLSEIALREKVSLLPYSPLAQGFLTGKYMNGANPEGSRRQLFNRLQRYEGEGTLEAIDAYVNLARDHGLDPAQMALAYVDRKPFVTSTIIGATTMDQLKTDIDAFDVKLPDEVLDGIRKIHKWRPNPTR